MGKTTGAEEKAKWFLALRESNPELYAACIGCMGGTDGLEHIGMKYRGGVYQSEQLRQMREIVDRYVQDLEKELKSLA